MFSFKNRTHRRGSSIQYLKRGKIQLIRGVTCSKEREGKEGHPVPGGDQSLLPTLSKFLLGSDSFFQPVLSSGDYIHNVTSISSPELGPALVQSGSQRQACYQSPWSLAARA